MTCPACQAPIAVNRHRIPLHEYATGRPVEIGDAKSCPVSGYQYAVALTVTKRKAAA